MTGEQMGRAGPDDEIVHCDRAGGYHLDAVLLALAEVPVQTRVPTDAGLSTRDAEAADARRWFRGDARRVDAYLQWVDAPLAGDPPKGTPAVAERYRRAVGRLRAGDVAGARAAFEAIVALPPRAGRLRAVWAAFMLGNLAYGEKDPDARAREQARWYGVVRARVKAGTPDPLGLLRVSMLREAGARQGWDDATSLQLCATAGGWSCADPDLAARTLALPERELRRAGADPWLASAVTAQLTSLHEDVSVDDPVVQAAHGRWIAAVEAGGAKVARGAAASMARLLYQRGEWTLAARWSRRGDPRDPRVADIRAQLARRSGDPRAVIAALTPLAHLSLTHGAWLGEAQLDVGRYEAAMATFLRSGNWMDAAWVAERVLTPEELARAIPRMPAVDADDASPDDYFYMSFDEVDRAGQGIDATPPESPERRRARAEATTLGLHLVLARRLARMGRWDEAAEHFSRVASGAARADLAHALGVRGAAAAAAWRVREAAVTPEARADATLAFFDAVLPERLRLFATEGYPDYAAYSGAYGGDVDLAEYRITSGRAGPDERARILASVAERYPGTRPGADGTSGTDALLARFDAPVAYEPEPHLRRYHFLWPLAALAWSSAQGLEAGDPRLVQLLCRGGRLLRNRDTDTADLYYKRLVWDGRPDPVAQVADTLRWFPEVDEESGACLASPWPPPPPPPTARQRAHEAAQRAKWSAMRAATERETDEARKEVLAQRFWMGGVARFVGVAMALLVLTARWGRRS
jgi:hypothetical protein